MSETMDTLKERTRKDRPENEDALRGTCRSCGWSERLAGPLDVTGLCPMCYSAWQVEKDREYWAILSRRRI